MINKLKDLDILVIGQLITSRTETIESYLKDKVKSLGLIGFSSLYATKNVSRCLDYQAAKIVRQFSIPTILIKKSAWYKQPILIFYFIFLSKNIIKAARRLKKKYDVVVGVACFSALMAIILKKLGITRKVVYYCIDYYPQPPKLCFPSFVIYIIKHIDRFCIKHSDVVWNITSRIIAGRNKIGGISPASYKHIIVPMCYDVSLLCAKEFYQIEKNTIAFVGTLSQNQGLQLIVEAMPEIIKKIPQVKVEVVGHGPYAETVRKLVRDAKVSSCFNFHGFIEDERTVLDILSRCAVGLATWVSSVNDNAVYADPGKPKLYAFCGVPIIITKVPEVAAQIDKLRAGIAINYDKEELIAAIVTLLCDEAKLSEYRRNVLKFAKDYTSDVIYTKAWGDTLDYLYNN